jgi:hypothetical protein
LRSPARKCYDQFFCDAGWSSPVARWAHNPKVAGSNPAPATNLLAGDFVPGPLTHSLAGPRCPAPFVCARRCRAARSLPCRSNLGRCRCCAAGLYSVRRRHFLLVQRVCDLLRRSSAHELPEGALDDCRFRRLNLRFAGGHRRPRPVPRSVKQECQVTGLPTGIQPRQNSAVVEVVGHRPVRNIEASDVALQRNDVRNRFSAARRVCTSMPRVARGPRGHQLPRTCTTFHAGAHPRWRMGPGDGAAMGARRGRPVLTESSRRISQGGSRVACFRRVRRRAGRRLP